MVVNGSLNLAMWAGGLGFLTLWVFVSKLLALVTPLDFNNRPASLSREIFLHAQTCKQKLVIPVIRTRTPPCG